MENFFYGRKLLLSEITAETKPLLEQLSLKTFPTMKETNDKIRCLRCNQLHLKKAVKISSLGKIFYYCPSCIQLGRVQSDQSFYSLPAKAFPKIAESCTWQGNLTVAQQAVSDELIEKVAARQRHLVWATTGAGKTEMFFSIIEMAVAKGWRVAIAAPRVDVCLELYPRITEAFKKIPAILLYGKQTEAYRYTQIVVCTMHQLLRFYQAFDLIILDEVDSFPYVGDERLQFGVEQALKPKAPMIFLTATPDQQMKKQLKNGLSYSLLPARYHKQPLPTPKLVWLNAWNKKLKAGKLAQKFVKEVALILKKQQPLLVFCPTISGVEQMCSILKTVFPTAEILGVHAQDELREEKVLKMRAAEVDILVTSTILERGVTFKGVQVFVYGANHPVFTTSALVQIAGRVGRNVKIPSGKVYFFHDGKTKSLVEACAQIKHMNQTAAKRGLLE